MQNSNEIRYLSAPCGSGKTHAICSYIKQYRAGSHYLYVAPSLKLLNQTLSTLELMGVSARAITSENETGVVKEVMRCLKHTDGTKLVLLITWQAYERIPYFPKKHLWKIFIDEIPQVDHFYPPRVTVSAKVFTDHLELETRVKDQIATLKAIHPDGLLRRLGAHQDTVIEGAEPILRAACSQNVDLFVDLASWNAIGDGRRVHFLAMLNPKLFEGTTIVGANFEHSMLYFWLKNYHGCELQEAEELVSRLRYTEHDPALGERLEISYLLKDRSWSKYYRNQIVPDTDGQTVGDQLVRVIAKETGDTEFLLVDNNGVVTELEYLPGATRIPPVSHRTQ